ncbi:MAG: hypothetical protein HY645_11110 [Acidobacteria bacterium]|nr:hypothetical protein [Acidobacteriota bacterium]
MTSRFANSRVGNYLGEIPTKVGIYHGDRQTTNACSLSTWVFRANWGGDFWAVPVVLNPAEQFKLRVEVGGMSDAPLLRDLVAGLEAQLWKVSWISRL